MQRGDLLVRYLGSGGLKSKTTPDSWEAITKIYYRESPYHDYPLGNKVPRNSGTYMPYSDSSNPPGNTKTRQGAYAWLANDELHDYFLRLPPTSYADRPALNSIFADGMKVTSQNGWRDSELFPKPFKNPPYIDYHRGVDIAPTTGTLDIYAPAGGEIWFYNSTDASTTFPIGDIVWQESQADPTASSGSRGLSDYYASKDYKTVEVLLTNPGDPENGRIYLFADEGTDSTGGYSQNLVSDFQQHFPGLAFPETVGEAVKVRAGQWIGVIPSTTAGNETAPHVHMEVYEYFPKDQVGQTNDLSTNDLNTSGHFDRVNPLTIFPAKYLTYGTDDTKKLESKGLSEGWLTDAEVKQDFAPWGGQRPPAYEGQ